MFCLYTTLPMTHQNTCSFFFYTKIARFGQLGYIAPSHSPVISDAKMFYALTRIQLIFQTCVCSPMCCICSSSAHLPLLKRQLFVLVINLSTTTLVSCRSVAPNTRLFNVKNTMYDDTSIREDKPGLLYERS